MAKSVMEAVAEDKARMVPKKGFRVVGVDRFSPPGEAAFPCGDYATKAEAEARRAELEAEEAAAKERAGGGHIATDFYIYAPGTK